MAKWLFQIKQCNREPGIAPEHLMPELFSTEPQPYPIKDLTEDWEQTRKQITGNNRVTANTFEKKNSLQWHKKVVLFLIFKDIKSPLFKGCNIFL